jgi:iron-sulfur cluster repair protein YtfE (RIC family)
MSATDSYRKQHAEFMELVKKIEQLLDPDRAVTGAHEVRSLLSSLTGKLSVHFAMEDKSLYPHLMQHADSAVRDTAKRFSTEMAGVRPALDAFNQKWTEREIAANPAGFCAETKKVFGVLADRIKRENNELYAMVDKLAAA